MEFIELKAKTTGMLEHDKFALEIARKNKCLKTIYDEVCRCITNIDQNSGYTEVDDMIVALKTVKTEIALMSLNMQTTMNSLIS